jgi:hypothetical protein
MICAAVPRILTASGYLSRRGIIRRLARACGSPRWQPMILDQPEGDV